MALLNSLESDPMVKIVEFDVLDYHAAMHLFQSRSDKEWGLVDCLSFVVMQSQGVTQALSADHHFVQAGFRALLLES